MNMVRIAHQLARAGQPQYEEKVKSFGGQSGDDIELAVLMALLDIGDEGALAKVLARIDQIANDEVRAKVVQMLDEHGELPAVVRKIGELARKDPSIRVRAAAVRVLADLEAPEALASLKEVALSDQNVEVRRVALRRLGESHIKSEELIPLLRKVALTETNESLAEAAARAMGDIPGPQALQALEGAYAEARSPRLRRTLVRAAADRQQEAPLALKFLLRVAGSDTDAEVRRSAVAAIGDMETPEAVAALKELALSGAEAETRMAALRSLGDRRGKEAVEVLSAVLKSEKDARMRKTIAASLGETGNDAAVPVLADLAKTDPNAEVRRAAVAALGEIGTPIAREALIRLLETKKEP
jgi:HEAT repeat protein